MSQKNSKVFIHNKVFMNEKGGSFIFLLLLVLGGAFYYIYEIKYITSFQLKISLIVLAIIFFLHGMFLVIASFANSSPSVANYSIEEIVNKCEEIDSMTKKTRKELEKLGDISEEVENISNVVLRKNYFSLMLIIESLEEKVAIVSKILEVDRTRDGVERSGRIIMSEKIKITPTNPMKKVVNVNNVPPINSDELWSTIVNYLNSIKASIKKIRGI